ncbi:MAG: Gfo/Idh/MocA family protein, partial [Planctomycetota bacterium]
MNMQTDKPQTDGVTGATAIKRIAIIGVSHRSIKLSKVLQDEVDADHWRIVGLWDVDPKRFEAFTIAFPEQTAIPTYLGDDTLEPMLDELRPDVALVCTMDRYHAPVAIRCLQRGIDVVVEKPMVIDSQQAQDLLDAEAASTAGVHVAFNYRYQQKSRMLKHLLDQQTIGRVTAVEMNVYLNEIHGSSFFQRWNRYRANSGGLSIHKEGHYLDMLCWWLDQKPVEVFCYGALNYYGPDGEMNPSRKDGRVCHDCDEIDRCAYQQVRRRKDPIDTHIGDLQKIDFGKRDK